MGRFMAVSTVIVGLGFAAGFGALSVDSLLDYRAFPATPSPVTVADLAKTTAVARGTWVRVVDAVPDCAHGYAKPHDPSYVLVGDGKTSSVVIAQFDAPPRCDDLARTGFTGVPSVHRTVESIPGSDLPYGLAWARVEWKQWPAQRAVILWTRSGPENSRTGIWVGAGLALLGLFLVWYGVRWLLPRLGDAVVVDPSLFPSTVPLRSRGGMTPPATVVWLPVLRVEEVKGRGISTDVWIYLLALPAPVSPLATGKPRVISAHTGPGKSGLIFRSAARDAVAAARPAGSENYVVLRTDLRMLDLREDARKELRTRQLRLGRA